MLSRKPLILFSVAALSLAACVPQQPGTGGGVGGSSRATTGAVAGALVGSAIGASQSGDSRLAQAAVGGVIGAALGGAIGTALDRQAAALQGSVSSNTTVTNTGNALVVTMPQDILFATNSAALRPDLQRDLNAVAANLLSYPDSRIEIVGHTDNTGTAALNKDLSQRRAAAVATVLRDGGVPNSRITVIGRGEDMPIASNLTPEGRALNRRVEIIIRPTT